MFLKTNKDHQLRGLHSIERKCENSLLFRFLQLIRVTAIHVCMAQHVRIQTMGQVMVTSVRVHLGISDQRVLQVILAYYMITYFVLQLLGCFFS